MQDAFAILIWVVVGVAVVAALASLVARGKLYDQIGRGGLSIGEDRDAAPPRSTPAPVSAREREDDIRQMLAARNARRAARGQPALDVEAELASLTRPIDAGIREEIRALVEARNARRLARGQEPLDVEAEIERRLRDVAG